MLLPMLLPMLPMLLYLVITYVNYLTVLLQRSNEIIYVGVYGTNGQYTNPDSVIIRIMLVKLS